MRRGDCAAFLAWALPRLGLREAGYRRVSATVCKRLRRRLAALGLADLAAYRARLQADAGEWAELEALCRIPLSRVLRHRPTWEALGAEILPCLAGAAAAEGRARLRAWSAGCASGEEPASLLLAWEVLVRPQAGGVGLDVLATDADATLLARARRACYQPATLREVPAAWRERGFRRDGGLWCLRDELRARIALARQDLRAAMPAGPFDLILCRNLAFTYFDEAWQRRVLDGLVARLAAHGVLVVGAKERPPRGAGLLPLAGGLPIYARPAAAPVAAAPAGCYPGGEAGRPPCEP